MELKDVGIEKIALGAISERLNDGFTEVLENIADPDTEATEAREINLKITLKPEKDRATTRYKIAVKTKLAGPKASEGLLFVSKRQGKYLAFEQNPDQMQMFNTPPEVPDPAQTSPGTETIN